MGQKRRILKNLNKSIRLYKTGLTFEGYDLLIADPLAVPRFRSYWVRLMGRANIITALANYSLGVRAKILKGESVWN